MTNSRKFMTAALAAAMLAGTLSASTPASASRHHGYQVSLQHRGVAYSAAKYWRSYWGLHNPELCGYWGWAGCSGDNRAPAYATSADYCGPAFAGAASVTGLGYYGMDYVIVPRNYYGVAGAC